MKNRVFLSIFFVIGLSSQSHASATYGQASDLFNIGAGARAMAMGGAFTAISDDASAPYFNPAGLAYIDEHQVMAMHAPLFLNTNFNYLATANPFGDKWGTLALSNAMLSSDKFEVRDNFNSVTDSNASLRNSAIFASYAHKLPWHLSGGVNAKFIQQRVVGYSDGALGLDMGLMHRYWNWLSVGLVYSNLNSPEITLDSTPDKYRAIRKFGVAAEVFPRRLMLSADMIKVEEQSSLFAAGLEFTPHSLFQLRGGFNANRSVTLGVGLKLKKFRIDYAFSDTDLGAFNKVSFTWAWHNIYKTELEPPMKEGRAIYPLSGFTNAVAFKTNVPDQTVARWDLNIKNLEGKDVRRLHGDLRPPEIINWDALNAVGEPVVDGQYNYTFIVTYKNGKEWKVDGNVNLVLPQHIPQEAIDMELNGAKTIEEGKPNE